MKRLISVLALGLGLIAGSCGAPQNRSSGANSKASQPNRQVLGQIFVVTNSREAIRLPLVDVLAIAESTAVELVSQRLRARDSLTLVVKSSLARARSDRDASTRWLVRTNGLTPEWEARHRRGEVDFDTFIAGDPAVKRETANQARLALEVARLSDQLRRLSETEEWAFGPLPQPLDSARTDADGKFLLTVPLRTDAVLFAKADRATLSSTEQYFWIVRVPASSDTTAPVLLSNDNMTRTSSPASLLTQMTPSSR